MGHRTIQHPGAVGAQRVDAVPVHVRQVDLVLQPGRALLPALVQALPAGCRSAVLRLHGGTLAPFAYVMPALSKTPDHAVYFSDRFDAPGAVTLHEASVTFGERDGAPWLHCHARWTDAADGTPHCGHLLPDDAVLASPMAATAWLIDGAAFTVVPDAETGFTLFRPLPCPPAADAAPNALAVRVAPNEDICTALDAVCAERGITHATVRGGVGSTVGAAFDDGRVVEPFVTEVLVRDGRIAPGADGRPQAQLDVALVDHTGGLAAGRLQRGANGVLVTFELVLQHH
jgi:predicted DNA-binding protein with PD1-like motif